MSSLTRRNPFASFEPFPNVGLSLFEDTLNRFLSESPASRPWSPAVDIAENENELIVTADIPGVKMDDIDIKIENGTLSLSGKREFEKKQEKGGYHRIERNYGSFQRVFTLPETVDVDKVSAQFDSGVLKVTLPKKEVAKPKSVRVSVAGSI